MNIDKYNPVNTVDADDDYQLMIEEDIAFANSDFDDAEMNAWLDREFLRYQEEEMYEVV